MADRLVILGYLWRAPIMLAGQLAAYPLAPIAAALCDVDGRLPTGLCWLETQDQPGWRGPASVPHLAEVMYNGFPRVALTRWLWRNKAYRLSGHLGIKPTRGQTNYVNAGGSTTPPKWGLSLWWGVLTYRGRTYWELQPRLSLAGHVAYLRIGWKIIGYCRAALEARPWPALDTQAGMFNAVSVRTGSVENW